VEVSQAYISGDIRFFVFQIMTMRFSRNQIIGTLILVMLLWTVIVYRMLFSGA
jgi:hypothetical protein